MRLVRFSYDHKIAYGELTDNIIRVLEGDLFGTLSHTPITYSLDEVEILSPLENPGKVVAIGLNYRDHAIEKGREIPDEPMMFMVSPTAIIGHEKDIELPNEHFTEHEAELVVVMKSVCREVTEEEALKHVFGYTVGNDVSDRELQKKDKQFTRAKSFHTFKPLGPVIATDLDPSNLDIQLTLNGEIKQKSNTNQLIFSIPRIISDISKVMTLYPGDLIFTGTPDGVSPIQAGDVIEVTIEGIGTLRNKVKFAPNYSRV